MQSSNLYVSIFIVPNLYLAKLIQYDNQGFNFDYNYYNFFNNTNYM